MTNADGYVFKYCPKHPRAKHGRVCIQCSNASSKARKKEIKKRAAIARGTSILQEAA